MFEIIKNYNDMYGEKVSNEIKGKDVRSVNEMTEIRGRPYIT